MTTFRDRFLELRGELESMDPEAAGRRALNMAIDERWGQIEADALDYCESEVTLNQELAVRSAL